MDLNQLRTFVTVAELGHVTRAAERLHLSQPAVTGQLKALEDELCVTLFDRTRGGMLLTGAGKLMLQEAEQALGHAQEVKNLALRMKDKVAGRVRLGTIIDPDFLRLGVFLKRLIETYPVIEIETRHGISGWVFASVAERELDAGFFLGPIEHAAMRGTKLTTVTYRIVGPTAWRGRLNCADWKALAAFPWVWTPRTSSHNSLVSRMFEENGISPARRVVVADQEASMVSMVSAGMGLTLMREDLAFAAEYDGRVAVWRGATLSNPLSFIFRAERSHDPLIEAMAGVIRSIWAPAATAEKSSNARVRGSIIASDGNDPKM